VRWVGRHRLATSVLAVLVVFVLVTARLFVWPPTDDPAPVDAIVALGGDPGQIEAQRALALAQQGYGDTVVVSRGGYPPAPCPPAPDKVRVICFRADPLNTRGEAEYVARLAAARHWRRLMVVPATTQTTRARLLFERCTDVDLRFVPVRGPLWRFAYQVAYEWGALLKALTLHRSC